MQNVTLYTADGREIQERVREIASVSSHNPVSNPTRWTVLTLYKNEEGDLLCQEAGMSAVPGEVTRYQLARASAEEELIEKVGYGWLAKRMYDDAGIQHAVWWGEKRTSNGRPVQCLVRDNGPDVSFEGHLISSVSTDRPEPHRRGRWTELHLYELEGGALICHEMGCTRIPGELTRHQVHFAKDPTKMIGILGRGRLALDLYKQANWTV